MSEAYAPGLGELMTLQQMRHTKLWLAAQARVESVSRPSLRAAKGLVWSPRRIHLVVAL
jgi:hypothetical protein